MSSLLQFNSKKTPPPVPLGALLSGVNTLQLDGQKRSPRDSVLSAPTGCERARLELALPVCEDELSSCALFTSGRIWTGERNMSADGEKLEHLRLRNVSKLETICVRAA